MAADITLGIESIGAGGDGIGTLDGQPVYVPKTAPGDTVRARTGKARADGLAARLLAVQMPGPERTEPPCPHFTRCGGCALQHVSADFYRRWKIDKVRTALARAGVQPQYFEEPVFIPPGTRRRVTLAAFRNGSDIRFGYHEPRSKDIVKIDACPVLEPELAAAVLGLRPFLPRLLPERKAVDIMLQRAGGLDMVLTGPWGTQKGDFSLPQREALGELAQALDIARITHRDTEFAAPGPVLARAEIRKTFGTITVGLPPGAFLQPSAAGEETLAGIVRAHAGDARSAADLFCGSGTFAGTLLGAGMKVRALDGDAAAITALAATRHPDLAAEKRNLFKEPLSAAELAGFDAAVFDPPRAGAAEQARELARSDVARIIAVSCNPATFARDARTLIDGGYTLHTLRVVDQFAWSAHVETAALFTR